MQIRAVKYLFGILPFQMLMITWAFGQEPTSFVDPVVIETASVQDLKTIMDAKAQIYGAENVLLVSDVDHAIVRMPSDVGTTHWIGRQIRLVENGLAELAPDQVATSLPQLLNLESRVLAEISMIPIEPTTVEVYQYLYSRRFPIFYLTARPDALRSITHRELSRLNFPFSTFLSELEGFDAWLKKNNAQGTGIEGMSIEQGIVMAKEMDLNKGIALQKLWTQITKTWKGKSIVFFDDSIRMRGQVLQAFKNSGVDITIVTYTHDHPWQQSFDSDVERRTAAHKEWNRLYVRALDREEMNFEKVKTYETPTKATLDNVRYVMINCPQHDDWVMTSDAVKILHDNLIPTTSRQLMVTLQYAMMSGPTELVNKIFDYAKAIGVEFNQEELSKAIKMLSVVEYAKNPEEVRIEHALILAKYAHEKGIKFDQNKLDSALYESTRNSDYKLAAYYIDQFGASVAGARTFGEMSPTQERFFGNTSLHDILTEIGSNSMTLSEDFDFNRMELPDSYEEANLRYLERIKKLVPVYFEPEIVEVTVNGEKVQHRTHILRLSIPGGDQIYNEPIREYVQKNPILDAKHVYVNLYGWLNVSGSFVANEYGYRVMLGFEDLQYFLGLLQDEDVAKLDGEAKRDYLVDLFISSTFINHERLHLIFNHMVDQGHFTPFNWHIFRRGIAINPSEPYNNAFSVSEILTSLNEALNNLDAVEGSDDFFRQANLEEAAESLKTARQFCKDTMWVMFEFMTRIQSKSGSIKVTFNDQNKTMNLIDKKTMVDIQIPIGNMDKSQVTYEWAYAQFEFMFKLLQAQENKIVNLLQAVEVALKSHEERLDIGKAAKSMAEDVRFLFIQALAVSHQPPMEDYRKHPLRKLFATEDDYKAFKSHHQEYGKERFASPFVQPDASSKNTVVASKSSSAQPEDQALLTETQKELHRIVQEVQESRLGIPVGFDESKSQYSEEYRKLNRYYLEKIQSLFKRTLDLEIVELSYVHDGQKHTIECLKVKLPGSQNEIYSDVVNKYLNEFPEIESKYAFIDLKSWVFTSSTHVVHHTMGSRIFLGYPDLEGLEDFLSFSFKEVPGATTDLSIYMSAYLNGKHKFYTSINHEMVHLIVEHLHTNGFTSPFMWVAIRNGVKFDAQNPYSSYFSMTEVMTYLHEVLESLKNQNKIAKTVAFAKLLLEGENKLNQVKTFYEDSFWVIFEFLDQIHQDSSMIEFKRADDYLRVHNKVSQVDLLMPLPKGMQFEQVTMDWFFTQAVHMFDTLKHQNILAEELSVQMKILQSNFRDAANETKVNRQQSKREAYLQKLSKMMDRVQELMVEQFSTTYRTDILTPEDVLMDELFDSKKELDRYRIKHEKHRITRFQKPAVIDESITLANIHYAKGDRFMPNITRHVFGDVPFYMRWYDNVRRVLQNVGSRVSEPLITNDPTEAPSVDRASLAQAKPVTTSTQLRALSQSSVEDLDAGWEAPAKSEYTFLVQTDGHNEVIRAISGQEFQRRMQQWDALMSRYKLADAGQRTEYQKQLIKIFPEISEAYLSYQFVRQEFLFSNGTLSGLQEGVNEFMDRTGLIVVVHENETTLEGINRLRKVSLWNMLQIATQETPLPIMGGKSIFNHPTWERSIFHVDMSDDLQRSYLRNRFDVLVVNTLDGTPKLVRCDMANQFNLLFRNVDESKLNLLRSARVDSDLLRPLSVEKADTMTPIEIIDYFQRVGEMIVQNQTYNYPEIKAHGFEVVNSMIQTLNHEISKTDSPLLREAQHAMNQIVYHLDKAGLIHEYAVRIDRMKNVSWNRVLDSKFAALYYLNHPEKMVDLNPTNFYFMAARWESAGYLKTLGITRAKLDAFSLALRDHSAEYDAGFYYDDKMKEKYPRLIDFALSDELKAIRAQRLEAKRALPAPKPVADHVSSPTLESRLIGGSWLEVARASLQRGVILHYLQQLHDFMDGMDNHQIIRNLDAVQLPKALESIATLWLANEILPSSQRNDVLSRRLGEHFDHITTQQRTLKTDLTVGQLHQLGFETLNQMIEIYSDGSQWTTRYNPKFYIDIKIHVREEILKMVAEYIHDRPAMTDGQAIQLIQELGNGTGEFKGSHERLKLKLDVVHDLKGYKINPYGLVIDNIRSTLNGVIETGQLPMAHFSVDGKDQYCAFCKPEPREGAKARIVEALGRMIRK